MVDVGEIRPGDLIRFRLAAAERCWGKVDALSGVGLLVRIDTHPIHENFRKGDLVELRRDQLSDPAAPGFVFEVRRGAQAFVHAL